MAFNRPGDTRAVAPDKPKAFDRVLDGKSSHKYSVNAGVPQGSMLGPTFFQLYINDFSNDVICKIAIYADNTTLYSNCNQTLDLRQKLKLASELESDL